jgi:probable HAF family extracellular repeat protein
MINTLLAQALLMILGIGVAAAADASNYSLHQIGSLGGGTQGHDLNNLGQVVGRSYLTDSSYHAFVTGPNGTGITDLGSLGETYSEAVSINDVGEIGAVSYTLINGDGVRSFIINPNGSGLTTSQKILSPYGGDLTTITHIDNAGRLTGNVISSDSYVHAFITGKNGVGISILPDLTPPGRTSIYTGSASSNNVGQIIGTGLTYDDEYYTFITDVNNGGVTFLGTFGGSTIGMDINNKGQVVGYSHFDSDNFGQHHAFFNDGQGTAIKDLGALEGKSNSIATTINDLGQVAGFSYNVQEVDERAFITDINGTNMVDLNSLVPLSDGAWFTAAAINNRGQILALTNDDRTFLLSPVPELETYSMLMAGLGLMGFILRSRRQREVI